MRYFFKVDIDTFVENKVELMTLFLESERDSLSQRAVEDVIFDKMEKSTNAWMRMVYDSMLISLRNVEKEYGEPMNLLGGGHYDTNRPVSLGRGALRFRGAVSFTRLEFDKVVEEVAQKQT